MVLCSLCKEKVAVIKIRYANLALCKECFVKHFEEKVEKYLLDTNLSDKLNGKLIVVATSGGKDSLNTLFILNKFKATYDFSLLALLIDEGIANYREYKRRALESFCKKFKIDLLVISLYKELGHTIDNVAKWYKEGKISLKPCSICGVFRRYLINLYANELQADFVATGHNLDDEVQTFIMNFIRGDLLSIVREGPLTQTIFEGFVPRIKPLYYVYEKESLTYFLVNDLKTPYVECPYARLSLRYRLRTLLNRLEYNSPGTKLKLLKLKDTLREELKDKVSMPKLRKCELCGMPTVHKICRACSIRLALSKV